MSSLYQHIFILSYRMCIPNLVKIQWIRLLRHQNAPVKLSWVNLGSMCSHGAMVAKGLLRWKNVLKPELCKALRGEAISMLQEAMPVAQWGGIFVNSVGSKWNNGKMQRCWLVWTLVRYSSCFLFCSRHCKFDKKRLWRGYFWALDEVGGYFFIFSWNPVPKNAWIVHTQQHRPKVPKMYLRWKHIQKPFGCLISHQGHPAKSTCLKVSQPSLRAVWHNLQRWLLDPIREPKVLASHLDTTLHWLHNFLSYG